MPKKYTCELCKKEFNQKIDYTRHKEKKAPCISVKQIQQNHVNAIKQENESTTLATIFDYCLNILRDNEHLIGDKALRTLAHLLILRLIEPKIGKELDFDNYDGYPLDDIDEDQLPKVLEYVRFSNLANAKEDNIVDIMRCIWSEILSHHPSTCEIFKKGRCFDITSQSTYVKIIKKLAEFDFSSIDSDIQGEAYEHVIKAQMIGKTLGQFFTPPCIKEMMVELVNPVLNDDGTMETIFDPAMGTGGFLINALRHIVKQSKIRDIDINWDFVSSYGLGGIEPEPDTFQLALANMFISTTKMFSSIQQDDSIRKTIKTKYDIVLANPPFGISGLNYDEITDSLRNEYLPIKSNEAVPLFIQAIIYMLKINGRCAVVLPDGKELFNRSDTLVALREYLMKTCDLKEVISLPSGVFTHTGIKTCVFVFVKKRECNDVITPVVTHNKNQKETKRTYNFTKTHQTKNVMFYDYNPYEKVKTLLVSAPIEEIATNYYSLNYSDYLEKEDEEEYEEGVVIKTLGEVCVFAKKSKRQASYGNKTGLYPFYTSSIVKELYVDTYDYEYESIIIGDGGEPNVNYGVQFSVSDHCHVLYSTDEQVSMKYIYYYMFNNLGLYSKLYTGVGIKNISKDKISKIKIPVPSLERQQEIVDYLDFIYEKCNKTSSEKISEFKKLNEYCLKNQQTFGVNDMMTLGEVCTFQNGKNITKKDLFDGEYPVIGGGKKPLGYHNQFNTDENTILCSSSGAYSGYISRYNTKVWASDCFSVKSHNDAILINDFMYYYLRYKQTTIYTFQSGAAQPHVYSKDLRKFKIPVPSLERQQEIVDYCEKNDALIKQLEDEIANNRIIAKQFMQSINKSADESVHEVIPNIAVQEDVSTPVVAELLLEQLTSKGKQRCQGITKSGSQCKSQAICCNIYCKRHTKD